MQNILNINDLPPEKLPDFWHDNARINALYAPFRDQTVNSQDWDSKLHFWKSLINTWCNYNKFCIFSESELKKYFVRTGRTPACLTIVLNEMYKDKELQTLNEFMEIPQNSWSGWAVNIVVKKPVIWSWNKIKNTFLTSVTSDTKFVHIPSIQQFSDTLYSSVPNISRNKLLNTEELFSVAKFENVNPETVQLILHYLLCHNKIALVPISDINDETTDKEIILIKVGFTDNKVLPVNEIDIGKYRLEQHEQVLVRKIEEFEMDRTEATENVKAYLKKGMRQMAKSCLRKQHEIEKRIEKHVSALENLQVLLERIGTAESDSKVFESYKTGVAALKLVFKENNVSVDDVSDTMLDVGETLELHDDIQSTLSKTILSDADAELEDELAELLEESPESAAAQPTLPQSSSQNSKASQDDLALRLQKLKLPSVPNELPGPVSVKEKCTS